MKNYLPTYQFLDVPLPISYFQAGPIDAGTDNGFTFTSPNWPTSPQAAMFEITNEIPSHPAGSFHYPEKKSLPPIATFTFVKEKEYELSEVFDFNLKKVQPKNKTKANKYLYEVDNNEAIDNSIVTFVPTTMTPRFTTTETTSKPVLNSKRYKKSCFMKVYC